MRAHICAPLDSPSAATPELRPTTPAGVERFVSVPSPRFPNGLYKPSASRVLTDAEHAVVARLLQGLTTAQIARARGVSRATVSSQLQSIYRKLGVTSRAELACALE